MRRALALVVVAACGARSTAPRAPDAEATDRAPDPVVTTGELASASAGKRVVVMGTAGNAKLAAAIVADGGLVVYCLGQDSWPEELDGKPISARGTLEQTDEFASDGTSAGTDGPVWVLRDCRYETPR